MGKSITRRTRSEEQKRYKVKAIPDEKCVIFHIPHVKKKPGRRSRSKS